MWNILEKCHNREWNILLVFWMRKQRHLVAIFYSILWSPLSLRRTVSNVALVRYIPFSKCQHFKKTSYCKMSLIHITGNVWIFSFEILKSSIHPIPIHPTYNTTVLHLSRSGLSTHISIYCLLNPRLSWGQNNWSSCLRAGQNMMGQVRGRSTGWYRTGCWGWFSGVIGFVAPRVSPGTRVQERSPLEIRPPWFVTETRIGGSGQTLEDSRGQNWWKLTPGWHHQVNNVISHFLSS